MTELTSRRRLLVLATVCLAAFAINLDTTIVNVALPDLGRQLGATTRDLQWIVDGYNLAFAALVLTAGSLGDRFGRRPALLIGLGGLRAVQRASGRWSTSASALVAVRFVMGAGAAVIFPTTLSIITNAFPDRGERAKAIGLWGAVTGLGVAIGPVTGGLLLAHFGWPSVFVALVPVALVALVATWVWVPESSDPAEARLDLPGLILSSAAIGLLVYTIIEAPGRGWSNPATVWPVSSAAAVWSSRSSRSSGAGQRPMIDVTLFRTPAFSAASASVTVAFFALFGFIFLVTQYFQFMRGFGTLSTGRADPARGDHHRHRLGGWRRARRPHRHPRRRDQRARAARLVVRLDRAVVDVHALRPNRRADGVDGPRPRTHDRTGDGVDPQRAAAGQGGRRVGGERRDPRGRRHARRRGAGQHLHQPLRQPPHHDGVQRTAQARRRGRAELGRRGGGHRRPHARRRERSSDCWTACRRRS